MCVLTFIILSSETFEICGRGRLKSVPPPRQIDSEIPHPVSPGGEDLD